jgi:hypothetical protein
MKPLFYPGHQLSIMYAMAIKDTTSSLFACEEHVRQWARRQTNPGGVTCHLFGGEVTLGAMRTTSMSALKSAPSLCITPSRKPCESPRVAPGFIAAKIRGYSFACPTKANCRHSCGLIFAPNFAAGRLIRPSLLPSVLLDLFHCSNDCLAQIWKYARSFLVY